MSNPLLTALDPSLTEQEGPLIKGFDWSVHGISRLYIIVMSGRSGSTWLQHLIEDTKLAGFPGEYFNESSIQYYMTASSATGPTDYLSALARTYSCNQTFGFKINPDRLFWLKDVLDVDTIFTAKGCKWFFMTRVDFVAQAYSFLSAKQSGKWHTYVNEAAGDAPKPLPDDESWFDSEMWKIIYDVIRQEQQASQYFQDRKIVPVCYSYEDMLTDKRVPLLLTLRHVGVAPGYALGSLDHLVDRVVKNPVIGDERLISFVARFAEPIIMIHRNRLGINLDSMMRDLAISIAGS